MELAVIVLYKTEVVRELLRGLEDLGLQNPTFVDSAGSAQFPTGLPFLRFGGFAGGNWRTSVTIFALAPSPEHWEQAAELAERLVGKNGNREVVILSVPVSFARVIWRG